MDRLLLLAEIAEKTRLAEATLRFKKHRGEITFLFRLGKRLVGYESDVDAWIKQRRDAALAEGREAGG